MSVAISTEGSVLTRGLVWHQAGRASFTLAVRASYEITSAGSLVLVLPRPFEPGDEALAFTGDLAPFKPRCDVTFRGAVHARGPSVGVHARFALLSAGRPLFDRRLYVHGERDASGIVAPFSKMPVVYERALGGPRDPANPAGSTLPMIIDAARPKRPGCLAPIPPSWPVRSAQLAGAELRRQGQELMLSHPFPWLYFQEAPFEQQVDGLAPGDEILIEGLNDKVPSLRIKLPAEAPRALAGNAPLDLRLDTVRVDGDAGVVSLVWRGVTELAAAPAGLRVTFATALAAQATAAVEQGAVDVPLAPFLVAMKAAQAAQPVELPTVAEAPKVVEVPTVAEAPKVVEVPTVAEVLKVVEAPKVVELPGAPAPPAPPAPPPPPPPPPPLTASERLQRAGVSASALAALERARARRPAAAPPPEEE